MQRTFKLPRSHKPLDCVTVVVTLTNIVIIPWFWGWKFVDSLFFN